MAERGLRGEGGRGVPRARGAAGLLHAAVDGRLAPRPVLHQHLSAERAAAPQDRLDHLPRGDSGAPLPARDRAGADRPAALPHLRLADGGRRLCGGLGPVLRAAGRRDGALPVGRGALRRARHAGLPRRPPDRGLGAARLRLETRARHRTDARTRIDAPRGRGDRGRPIHHLAGPGAVVQDRAARDRARATPSQRADGRPIRPARVPRRAAWPRLAAPRDPASRDARLGRGGGLGARRHARRGNPPQRAPLSGRFVRREPIEERHRDDLLAAAAQDPATFRYMGTDLSIGPESWPAYLEDALRPEFVTWATVDAATGRAVGSSRFGDIAPEHGRAEIGWTWIAPSHQRTAANTEANLLPLSYALEELGATRVALKTDGRNERSQAAIERLGG